MTREEIVYQIEEVHQNLSVTQISRIDVGDKLIYGYFNFFDDSFELKKEGKYRFVENSKRNLYVVELAQTNKANTKYSIILDVNHIIRISVDSYNPS